MRRWSSGKSNWPGRRARTLTPRPEILLFAAFHFDPEAAKDIDELTQIVEPRLLPALRGLGDDRLRIKVDGMDLISACGNHMNPPMSYIDPTSVETIEVMAGVTPVSQGGDSIGGSILVESVQPQFAEAGADAIASAEAGSFYRSNADAMGANLSATAANESVSIRYSGAYASANNYRAGDGFVFGPETRGLSEAMLAEFPPGQRLRLPMVPGNRSLNLSNAVAVTVFEAWRQAGFPGAA